MSSMDDSPTFGQRPNDHEFDQGLSVILRQLEHIRKNMPNGELQSLQEKFTQLEKTLEKSQQETKDDLRKIKKILLDPEDGLIVRVNESIKLAEKQEEYRENVISKKLENVKLIEDWKEGVTKVLWILFATLAGIILNLVFKK